MQSTKNTAKFTAADKDVNECLMFMQENNSEKTKRDNKNIQIKKLYMEGFVHHSATGPRYISNKMLFQVMSRTMQRTKLLDFTFHGVGRPESREFAVREGIGTVLKNGNLPRVLRNKAGAFFKMWLLGDSFIHFGSTNNPEIPIKFATPSNSNVYVNEQAVEMRNDGAGQSVTQMAVVYSYPTPVAWKLFPQLKKNKISGRVSRPVTGLNDLERSNVANGIQDLTEVCFYYNIATQKYVVFAGSNNSLMMKEVGKKYGFMYKKEAYIPTIHLYSLPSFDGFYNNGVGDLLFDLSLVQQRLLNMGISHAEDNADPFTVVNLPSGQGAEFFNKIKYAQQQKAMGQRGWIPVEYGLDTGGGNGISVNSLMTQNAINELIATRDALYAELRRMGINLDDLRLDNDMTEMQILQEEETSMAFIKQTMEYNASEIECMINYTLDFVASDVKNSNKTLVESTTKIVEDGVEVNFKEFTFGMLAKELKDYDYWAKVNSRSGALPSNIFQQAQIARAIQLANPQSPAYGRLVQQYMSLNDRDFSATDLGFAGAEAGAQPSAGPLGGPEIDMAATAARPPQAALEEIKTEIPAETEVSITK